MALQISTRKKLKTNEKLYPKSSTAWYCHLLLPTFPINAELGPKYAIVKQRRYNMGTIASTTSLMASSWSNLICVTISSGFFLRMYIIHKHRPILIIKSSVKIITELVNVAIDPTVYDRNKQWVVAIAWEQTIVAVVLSPCVALRAKLRDTTKFSSRINGKNTTTTHWYSSGMVSNIMVLTPYSK